jgi:hypothetical protein
MARRQAEVTIEAHIIVLSRSRTFISERNRQLDRTNASFNVLHHKLHDCSLTVAF